jgi:hypothetical protein
VPQDPAVIQQQIEETRAELAETIDAIAEIVSPRRVAERVQEQLRVRAAELRQRYGPALGIGPGPGVPALTAASYGDPGAEPVERGGGQPGSAGPPAALPSGTAAVVRVVRWDRVALAGGGLLLVVGGVRRRRRRVSRRG